MRWSWLIPRLILVGLIWLSVAFGMDPWLRHTTIQLTQSATGAKVDIGTFNTGLFPPKLTVGHVALASASEPGTNLVEFEQLQCRLGGDPLLRKSFVVEEARLTGVRFGTVRNDDGQLDVQPPEEPQEPSWLTEKLKALGDEWLQSLLVDVREQLDPNTLETWRTGSALSDRWEQRMTALQQELKSFRPRVDRLQERIDQTKQLRSVARVQQYLELAGEAEQLLREANQLQSRIQALVPEAQADLQLLDRALEQDQQQIVRKVHLLTPNGRRIAESFIGPEMYRQLHEALTWLQFAADYQQELRSQTEVVRHRGVDVEFPVLNPLPGFLCRRAELSGELAIDHRLTPFRAVLSDVSSNPLLAGKPTMFRLSTAGDKPLQLAIRHTIAAGVPRTDVVAELHQDEPRTLSVGRADTAEFAAGLAGLHWTARLRLAGHDVAGTIGLKSDFLQPTVTSPRMNRLLQSAVQDVFRSVETVDATIRIAGTVRAPDIRMESEFGEKIAAGLQTAVARQAELMQAQLKDRVARLAAEQKQRLTKELNGRYQQLLADHRKTLEQVQGTQQLLASVRSGEADPARLLRQVSESGVLPQKTDAKVKRRLDKTEQLLQGLGGGLFR